MVPPIMCPIHIRARERGKTEIEGLRPTQREREGHTERRGVVIISRAADVSAAPRLWQIHKDRSIGGWPLWLASQQILSMPLPLTAPPGSISPTVARMCAQLAGGGDRRRGGDACLLCKGSPSLFLSFAAFFFLFSSSPYSAPGAII